MSVVPPEPCSLCGRTVTGRESMLVELPDGSLVVRCRWGTECAGDWIPPRERGR